MRRDRHLASGDLCRESAPLGQSSRASLLVDLPRDEMALLIELVGKRRWTPLCEFDEREIAVDWRNGLQSAVATDCNLMAECGGEMF